MTKAKPKIEAWSFSRFDDYDGCPAKAKYKHILKMKEKNPGPALQRGSDIHDKAEGYLNGTIRCLPVELHKFKDLFKVLRAKKMQPLLQIENELGLNKNWEECGWFGSDTWLRIKMDLMYDDPKDFSLRHVKDWKTGKENSTKHRKQLSLYGIGALVTAPRNIKTVKAQMVYLDHGTTLTETYQRADLEEMKSAWLKKTKRMLRDTTFKATPSSWACRWCFLSKAKGGPCKF